MPTRRVPNVLNEKEEASGHELGRSDAATFGGRETPGILYRDGPWPM